MGGKATKLPKGNPRRMTDFRCAWNGMDEVQRTLSLEWVLSQVAPIARERAKRALPILEVRETVTPDLEEAQQIVGGYVRMLKVPFGRCVLWLDDQVERGEGEMLQLLVDDDGLSKKLPINTKASGIANQHLVGNALLLRGEAMWF